MEFESYESPTLATIGSVHQITQATEKCDGSLDAYSAITGLQGIVRPAEQCVSD